MKNILLKISCMVIGVCILLYSCKKHNQQPCASDKPGATISPASIPADDSSLATVTFHYLGNTAFELTLTNGTMILNGGSPVSDLTIDSATSPFIQLRIRSSLVTGPAILYIRNECGLAEIDTLYYSSLSGNDNAVFASSTFTNNTTGPWYADGSDTSVLSFNIVGFTGAAQYVGKPVLFQTNNGNFLTPSGLSKQFTATIGSNGSALVRLIADTIPDTASVVATFDNNPNLQRSLRVPFSPLPYTLSLSTTQAQFNSTIVITLSTNGYFGNKTATFNNSAGIDSAYTNVAGIFTNSNSSVCTAIFNSGGTATVTLLDTIQNSFNTGRKDHIHISYQGGAYAIDTAVQF